MQIFYVIYLEIMVFIQIFLIDLLMYENHLKLDLYLIRLELFFELTFFVENRFRKDLIKRKDN